jgi:antitoxin CptB
MSADKERLRWRCRRGLLELDIVLNRFIEARYATLNGPQRAAFNALLDAPDTELWDMIIGRKETADPAERELLELLGKA